MKRSILIMDQDYKFLDLYQHILTPNRFFIFKCRSLESIVGFIESMKIDLIICDSDQPYGCGLELLEKLKILKCRIPVIIVSGAFYPSDKIISEEAYAFLPKSQILDLLPGLVSDESQVWKHSNTVKAT